MQFVYNNLSYFGEDLWDRTLFYLYFLLPILRSSPIGSLSLNLAQLTTWVGRWRQNYSPHLNKNFAKIRSVFNRSKIYLQHLSPFVSSVTPIFFDFNFIWSFLKLRLKIKQRSPCTFLSFMFWFLHQLRNISFDYRPEMSSINIIAEIKQNTSIQSRKAPLTKLNRIYCISMRVSS